MIKKHKNMYRSFLLITFLFLMIFSINANSLQAYKYNWTQLKTPNFTVVVEKNHLAFGKQVAQKAEQAAEILTALSLKRPKNTIIVIDHTKGYSNGSATNFPYPQIVLQPLLPTPDSSVGQYKDWLLELLVHEYTHILSFHNTRNLYTPLRWVLGNTISPAYFLPNWYLEGFAVYTESHLTQGGRLRSSLFNAYKNQLSEGNISIANEQDIGRFPYGSTPYIYGAWLNQDNLANTKPPESIENAKKIHRKLSGRIPFFLGGAYKSVSKKSIYKSWRELFKNKDRNFIDTKNSFQGTLPYYDEKTHSLFYLRLDPYLFDEIVQKTDTNTTVLVNKKSILNYKVSQDHLYYLALDLFEQDHEFFALYSLDLKTKKTEPLIEKENIVSFDVKDHSIAYIRSRLMAQEIVLYNTETKNKDSILSITGDTRLDQIYFINDNTLIFSKKTPNSLEQVVALELTARSQKILFESEHINFIRPSSDDLYILSENSSGRFLYSHKRNKLVQVKNELLNFHFTNQKSNSHYTYITPKGNYIYKGSLAQLKSKEQKQKINSPPIPEVSDASIKEKKYSSLSKLWPHYISPNAALSPYGLSGEYLVGLSTGSNDPLGLNNYSVTVSTDSISNRPSTVFSYQSNHFRLPITFSSGVLYEPLSLNLYRKSTFSNLNLNYTFNSSFSSSTSLNFGVNWSQTQTPVGDLEINRAGASANIFFKNAILRSRELAPRRGFTLYSSVNYFAPINSYYDYIKSTLGVDVFFKSPLHKTHRIVLSANGGIFDKPLIYAFFTENSQNQPLRNITPGSFVMRGLPTGLLLSNESYATTHLEYRFPLFKVNWGPGLLPVFINRFHAAFTGDYGYFKGLDFSTNRFINYKTPLYSAGAEIFAEGKLIYNVPITIQLGVYQFLNDGFYDGGPEAFLTFIITGL